MGFTNVSLKIRDTRGSKEVSGKFLVDSGAMFTLLPYKVWMELGLKPIEEREFHLIDGTTIKRNMSIAMIEYGNSMTVNDIILGEPDDQAVLGALTLEGMGLVLDPLKREIRQAELRL